MVYPDTSEIRADLPGNELQYNENNANDAFEPGSKEDMNNLTWASVDNADELSVVDNIQPNQPQNDGNEITNDHRLEGVTDGINTCQYRMQPKMM